MPQTAQASSRRKTAPATAPAAAALPKVLVTAETTALAPVIPAPPTAPATTIPPGPSLEPETREALQVAVMGDSLTDYRSNGGGFIRFLEKECPLSRFHNYGRGGEMTNQMRRRFNREILAPGKQPYSHIIIFGGVNDLYSDLTANRINSRIKEDLLAMYRAARASGAQVIGLTVAPWGGFVRYFNERRGKNTLELNRWILSQVGRSLDSAIDTHPLLRCGEKHQLCKKHIKPFNDGLHFGSEAHKIIGKALMSTVFSNCL